MRTNKTIRPKQQDNWIVGAQPYPFKSLHTVRRHIISEIETIYSNSKIINKLIKSNGNVTDVFMNLLEYMVARI